MRFVLASLKGDKQKFEKLILPGPKSDLIWNSSEKIREKAGKLTGFNADRITKESEEYLKPKLRRLMPGEEVTMLNGVTFTLSYENLGNDSAVIAIPDRPEPLFVVRIDGAWKLFFGPIEPGKNFAETARASQSKEEPHNE